MIHGARENSFETGPAIAYRYRIPVPFKDTGVSESYYLACRAVPVQPFTAWSLVGECEGRNERMRGSILVSRRNRCLRSSKQCKQSVNHDDRFPYGQLFLPKSSSLRGTGRKYSRVSLPPSRSYDGESKS
jgi:hypothetical protein